jgi:riboflavin kinase/FMN adenylyltransferase
MQKSAVTIGNFDGVHVAHRELFRCVIDAARENGLRPVVLTFDPHPASVVKPDKAPRLLTTMEERCALIREAGIEDVVVLPFAAEIARLSPQEFVERVLIERLQARIVVVGYNFHFGHRQAGDTKTLTELGQRFGFETRILGAVKRRGHMVSSSSVRRLVEAGNVALAARLLERPYALAGEIVPGEGVGSKQTVPTLNLQTKAQVLPARGVYITRTRDLDDGRRWNSVTNVGYRPTFDGHTLSIETFLLQPLDGRSPKHIQVEFCRRVRDERKFDSPEELKAQILRDVNRAQAFFRRLAGCTRAR